MKHASQIKFDLTHCLWLSLLFIHIYCQRLSLLFINIYCQVQLNLPSNSVFCTAYMRVVFPKGSFVISIWQIKASLLQTSLCAVISYSFLKTIHDYTSPAQVYIFALEFLNESWNRTQSCRFIRYSISRAGEVELYFHLLAKIWNYIHT